MNLVFANPSAVWFLLGIPVVVAIHLLQRKARKQVVTTLFLLEMIAPVQSQGRRIDWLRQSWPFWLQIIAVLLLTWILLGPGYVRSDSRQTITLVLDSSASMSAFREQAIERLKEEMPVWARSAATTNWIIVESDSLKPTLYSGKNLRDAIASLSRWQPRSVSHDPRPGILAGTTAALRQGGRDRADLVLFVTDRAFEMSAVEALGVGKPIANCGFTGITAEANTWRVLVRNYGAEPAVRKWSLNGIERGTISLVAGETKELSGDYTEGKALLELEPDDFAIDDKCPIVKPLPKRIGIRVPPGTVFDEFLQKLLASIPESEVGDDLEIRIYDALKPAEVSGTSITLVKEPGAPSRLVKGTLIAALDPLTAGLTYDGLLVNESFFVPQQPQDTPLLTQGGRQLLFLRGATKMVVNFDLRYSNAVRLPSFVLTLHRFIEQVRSAKAVPEVRNVETAQTLESGKSAPTEPGFFEDGLLSGAAHFADVREADFSGANWIETRRDLQRVVLEQNVEADFLKPLWGVLLIAVCIGNWLAMTR